MYTERGIHTVSSTPAFSCFSMAAGCRQTAGSGTLAVAHDFDSVVTVVVDVNVAEDFAAFVAHQPPRCHWAA